MVNEGYFHHEYTFSKGEPLSTWSTWSQMSLLQSFPGGSAVENLPANAEDTASISGLGRCPGKGSGNPLQFSYLGISMDREAWRVTKHEVEKIRTSRNN